MGIYYNGKKISHDLKTGDITREIIAEDVIYDNESSGLNAENVQEAIDEIVSSHIYDLNNRVEISELHVQSLDSRLNDVEENTGDLQTRLGKTEETTNELNNRVNALEGTVYVPIQSTDSFRERTTAEGETIVDGAYAIVNKLGGRSLKVCQLVDKSMMPESQNINGVIFTIDKTNGTVVANGTATADSSIDIVPYSIKNGHTYLLKGSAKGGSSETYHTIFQGFESSDFGEGQITTFGQDYSNYLRIVVKNGVTCNNLVFTPQLFDLTAMEQDTFVISIDAFKALYGDKYYEVGQYFVNANPTKLDSYSSNLFSGTHWVKGKYINSTTGSISTDVNGNYCEDYIKVLPNTQYAYKQFIIPNKLGVGIRFYDSSKNFLGGIGAVLTNGCFVFTTHSQAKYIRISQYVSDGGGDLPIQAQLNLGSTALPYREYTSDTLNISPNDLRELGLSNDDISLINYDDYENKKFVQNVGIVELSTLNWSYDSTNNFFNILFTAKKGGINFICSKYQNIGVRSDSEMASTPNMIIATNNKISGKWLNIKDTSYTDVASFKASLSGVYLIYQLANPIETDLEEVNDQYLAFNQGQEEFDSDMRVYTEIVYRGGKYD